MKLIIVLLIFSKDTFGCLYRYTSYQKSMECFPKVSVKYPATIEQIQDLIKTAHNEKTKVKAFGKLHSMVDLICTDGIPIDMFNFAKVTVNEAEKTVTAEAGATLHKIATELAKFNLALENLPNYRGISIGGATGSGTHAGSLTRPGTLSEQVVRMKIIDGHGEMREITDEEELKAFRVHLGLLGVVIEITLRAIPQFKVQMSYYGETEDELFANMVENARTSDVSEFFWSPNFKTGVVWKGTFVPMSKEGNDKMTLLGVASNNIKSGLKSSFENLQKTKNYKSIVAFEQLSLSSLVNYTGILPPPFIKFYGPENEKTTNPAVGLSYEMLSNYCGIDDRRDLSSDNGFSCGWEGGDSYGVYNLNPSIAITIDKIQEFRQLVKQIINKYPAVFVTGGIGMRFARKSDSFMAIENIGDSLHIEFNPIRRNDSYNDPIFGLNAYQAIVQLMITKLNGRPHWGKTGPIHHNSLNLKNNKMSEDLIAFQKIADKYDPHGLFNNDFKERIYGKSSKVTMNNKIERCALEDFCICRTKEQCGEHQICESYETANVCSDQTAQQRRTRMRKLRYFK